jgi:hypothetical protein
LAAGDGAGAATAPPPLGSQMRLRVHVSPGRHAGLHCGTHWPAAHANPGEQMGVQLPSSIAIGGHAGPGGGTRGAGAPAIGGHAGPGGGALTAGAPATRTPRVALMYVRSKLSTVSEKPKTVSAPASHACFLIRPMQPARPPEKSLQRARVEPISATGYDGTVERKTCRSQFGPRLGRGGPK